MAAKKRQRSDDSSQAPAQSISLPGLTYISLRASANDDSCTGLFVQEVDSNSKQLLCLFTEQELDDGSLQEALSAAGEIKVSGRRSVVAGGCSFRSCILQFSSTKNRNKVLGLSSSFPAADGDGALLGLRGWLSNLEESKVDQRALQSAVDGYMSTFDAVESAKEAAVASLASRMEADGFTLVTKGKKPRLEDSVDTGASSSAVESDNQKRKKKRGSVVKQDFYGFQSRENKLDKLAELRRRFEEDKERVKRIKEARMFKPY